MTPPNWQGVALDTHIYQMFSQAVRCLSFPNPNPPSDRSFPRL